VSKVDELIKSLQAAKELLAKRAPKGVDPDKHEKCVMDVKDQGHDVGSAHAICTSSMSKDETDEKIKAKMKAEMDKRKFGEADATKHVIDRDRGEKPKLPKPTPLLQTEQVVYKSNGQWSLEKDNSVKPFGQNIYNSQANINRKATRTGEERPEMGRNQGVRQYTTSGSTMQSAHDAAQNKEQKVKTKASTRTLADMSEEEKTALKAKYEKPLAKGADVVKEVLTTGELPILQDAGKQPTDEQMFGHLVKTEAQVAVEDAHWKDGAKRSMVEASKPIDKLNKSTVKATWSYGKSFNSLLKDELSEKEIAERNSYIGE